MKLIKILFALVITTGIFSACNDFENTSEFTPKVQFSVASLETIENGGPVVVEVQLVGEQRPNPVNVNFEVGGNATKGTDYNLSVDNSITIPANSSVASFTVDVIDNTQFSAGIRDIVMTITEASDGISPGHATEEKKVMTINIVDDDCPLPPIEGTWNVSTDGCAGDGGGGCRQEYADITSEVTITKLNDTEYELSDLTGGLYVGVYSDGAPNPGIITVNGSLITIDNQPDVVYGSDAFNGSGKINCNGTITLEWSNSWGDQGTTVFSPVE